VLSKFEKMNDKIRAIAKTDIPGLKQVVDASGLFPSAYLDNMIADYFDNSETQDMWFTFIEEDRPVAVGYCVPEKFRKGLTICWLSVFPQKSKEWG
jgi:hypothetical protein